MKNKLLALLASIAISMLPVHASTSGASTSSRSALGDQALSATALTHFRKALANVINGTGNAFVLCNGDSTARGFKATGTHPIYNSSTPGRLIQILNKRGIPAAEWISWINHAVDDDRWNTSAIGNIIANDGLGSYTGTFWQSGQTVSFTPGYTIDTIVVIYATEPSGHGTTSVNVDGGAALGTINGTDTSAIRSQTFTCARGTHTINLVDSGGTFVFGIWAYDSTVPAVMISNAGADGTKTADWVNTSPASFSSWDMLGFLTPDLTLYDLTINDSTEGTAFATWQSQIQSLITKSQAQGSDVLLVSGVPSDPGTYAGIDTLQAQYAAQLAVYAPQYSAAYLDMFNRWQSYSISNTLGLYTAADAEHPNNLGYTDWAQAEFNAIAGN